MGLRTTYRACDSIHGLLDEADHHGAFLSAPKRIIDETKWESTYCPVENPETECLLYDEDEAANAARLADVGENHIWTEIDWPNAYGAIFPGRHRWDVIGYVITERPWAESERDLLVLVEG